MKKALELSARINYRSVLVSIFAFVSILILLGAFTSPTPAKAIASPCILVMGGGASAVNINGSSKLNANGCTLTVLSNASPAISVVGSSKITASAVCAKSASITGSSNISPAIDPSCTAGNDPFVGEQKPAVGECQFNNISYTNSSKNTLQPGVYCGDIFLAGSTKNTLTPGVYIIKNGSFKVEGSSQVSGNDVVLFFTGTGGGLTIGGSAKVSLSAPTSGALKGFAIYMDPTATPSAQTVINGSSQVTLEGITYLPKQAVVVNGSSKIVASTLTTFIVKSIELNGSSNFQAVGALPNGPIPDTTAPVIAAHDDVTKVGTALGATVTYTTPTSTDDIDGPVAVACTPASGSTFPFGNTTVTCTSHDAVGNNATPSTFTVIVTLPPDVNAPVIAPHGDIVVAGDLNGVTVTYTTPTSTDNIDPVINVSCLPASGSHFAFGSTTVTCTAHDAAGNNAIPTAFDVFVVDQVAPVIAPHANIEVVGTSLGVAVNYTNPTAADNVDVNVVVSCAPISGSIFTAGTTTVLCNAQDFTGNVAAATSFDVIVSVPPPTPFTMASQSDESFLCIPDWRNCFTGGNAQIAIPLGLGSSLGNGTLLSVSVAKDETSEFANENWIIQLQCFTDAGYTTFCTDWVQPNAWNGFRPYLVSESTTVSTDGKHWNAMFTNPAHETNSNGSFPVTFRPEYYYKLIINDNGWNIGAYGSQNPSIPYYVITGMTF